MLAVLAALGLDARGAAGTAAPAPQRLAPAEIEDLLAFGDVLVSGSTPLAPGERALLVTHVETRMQQGGGYYADLYRTSVDVLGRLAGTRFAALDRAERAALVIRHRLGVADVRPDESLGPFPDEVRAVRTRTVPDLIGGYYASEAGWRVVGYSTFPGRCGDLARYTRSET